MRSSSPTQGGETWDALEARLGYERWMVVRALDNALWQVGIGLKFGPGEVNVPTDVLSYAHSAMKEAKAYIEGHPQVNGGDRGD